MKRTLFLALLLIASVASAQEQLPPGHVHAYAGAGLVMSLQDGRVAVAIGTGETVEHLFVYQPATPAEPIFYSLQVAAVDYWHDSLTVVAPTERVAFVLSLRNLPPRATLTRGARPDRPETETGIPEGYAVSRHYGGNGLAHYEGLEGVGLNEPELSDYFTAAQRVEKFGDPYKQKPPGGGNGGGYCASACSRTCAHGQATATCTPSPPYCAACDCLDDGGPRAYCFYSP